MINTIAEAKEANANAGYRWFEASSMRFFSSRLPKSVLPVDNGALFVSSEKCDMPYHPSEPRRYTIRFIHDSGKLETVGEFQQYATRGGANNRAHRLQLEWPSFYAAWDARDYLEGLVK